MRAQLEHVHVACTVFFFFFGADWAPISVRPVGAYQQKNSASELSRRALLVGKVPLLHTNQAAECTSLFNLVIFLSLFFLVVGAPVVILYNYVRMCVRKEGEKKRGAELPIVRQLLKKLAQ